MESALVVEGFEALKNKYDINICCFVGDGDSSVHKRLCERFPTKFIKKIECRNHLMRNFDTKMVAIAKNTSLNIISRKMVGKETRRMSIAIRSAVKYRKNENISKNCKVLNLRKDIENIPKHIFGDHTNCANYFCNPAEKKNKESVNMIPTLKKDKTYEEIMKNLNRLTQNSDSLIEDIDSNISEQFNSKVAKFVGGKRINYSTGPSYTDRCLLAVIQHNTGIIFFVIKIISDYYNRQTTEIRPKFLINLSHPSGFLYDPS